MLPSESQQPSISLRRLFPSASFVGCADIAVSEVTDDSRKCHPGTLFAALPGSRFVGIEFADEAVRRGARAILVNRPLAHLPVAQCVIPQVREAYGKVCAALSGSPSLRLKLTGVTGTNGKTTVTWLVRSLLQSAGKTCGLLGTVEYYDGIHTETASLTTPDAATLSQWLAAMVQQGVRHAAIEVSSHALDQDRVAGHTFDCVVVTNITQDHFDYHNNYESYLASKARLINHCRTEGAVVLNVDDPGSASLAEAARNRAQLITFGMTQTADISARILEESLDGSRFLLQYAGEEVETFTRLIGRHNVANTLAAAAVAIRQGLDLETIAKSIANTPTIPGRLERVTGVQDFDVFVDYAHTDDALRRSIRALKRLTAGRVICVFGAGGDRDRNKRPLMGQAASTADLAVVTSDNPRTEEPREIIRDILSGFVNAPQRPYVSVDRQTAIEWALQEAQAGDCVLIAGKGHETYQIIGEERIPLDDREVVREALKKHLRSPKIELERVLC